MGMQIIDTMDEVYRRTLEALEAGTPIENILLIVCDSPGPAQLALRTAIEDWQAKE